MRRIDPSRSVLVYWADLTYHEAALLADDDAKHLAQPVAIALDEFNTVLKLDLDTRRSVLKANAKASVADVHLDEGIRKLHSATLFLVNQVRKQPEFKSLFSETIDKVVRYALKRQVEVADKLIETLGLKIYSDEFRNAHVGGLQTLVTSGRAVLGEVRTAELGRTEARLDIRAWKDDVNAIRLANYGALVAIAAKSGRTKDWADAFFLSAKASSTDDDEDSAEAPTEPAAPTG
jgi:ABC-type arginine transport system ATPase subunit